MDGISLVELREKYLRMAEDSLDNSSLMKHKAALAKAEYKDIYGQALREQLANRTSTSLVRDMASTTKEVIEAELKMNELMADAEENDKRIDFGKFRAKITQGDIEREYNRYE